MSESRTRKIAGAVLAREPSIKAYHTRPTRVNARLDPETARKLEEVVAATGDSVTQSIKRAIDLLHEQHQVALKKPRSNAYLASLIGKYSGGPPDLAENHKKYFAEAMDQKYGHHR